MLGVTVKSSMYEDKNNDTTDVSNDRTSVKLQERKVTSNFQSIVGSLFMLADRTES